MFTLDYRQFLIEELSHRRKRNPSYSARAMARDLSISAPFLSQILSGQRLLSEDRAHAICKKMPWTRWKREAFTQLTRLENAQDPALRAQILRDVKCLMNKAPKRTHSSMQRLRHDEFRVVSDWQHGAIYELADTQGFQNDPQWIANRLGISPQQAEEAIKRLLQVRLLERDERGVLSKSREGAKMGAIPSSAIRKFHDQHLTLAKAALAEDVRDTRDFSGTTMAIDPKRLPRAKAMIRKFQDQLMRFLECGDRTAVFHFSTQLYRLDNGGKD